MGLKLYWIFFSEFYPIVVADPGFFRFGGSQHLRGSPIYYFGNFPFPPLPQKCMKSIKKLNRPGGGARFRPLWILPSEPPRHRDTFWFSLKVHSHYAFFRIFVCNLRQMQRMGSIPIFWV